MGIEFKKVIGSYIAEKNNVLLSNFSSRSNYTSYNNFLNRFHYNIIHKLVNKRYCTIRTIHPIIVINNIIYCQSLDSIIMYNTGSLIFITEKFKTTHNLKGFLKAVKLWAKSLNIEIRYVDDLEFMVKIIKPVQANTIDKMKEKLNKLFKKAILMHHYNSVNIN